MVQWRWKALTVSSGFGSAPTQTTISCSANNPFEGDGFAASQRERYAPKTVASTSTTRKIDCAQQIEQKYNARIVIKEIFLP